MFSFPKESSICSLQENHSVSEHGDKQSGFCESSHADLQSKELNQPVVKDYANNLACSKLKRGTIKRLVSTLGDSGKR